MTDPWLAINADGEMQVVQIPNGEVREYVPFNVLSRSNVSIQLHESGSMRSFGVDSDASGAQDALKKAMGHAAGVRGFGGAPTDGPKIAFVLIKADTLTLAQPLMRVLYEDGRIVDAAQVRSR